MLVIQDRNHMGSQPDTRAADSIKFNHVCKSVGATVLNYITRACAELTRVPYANRAQLAPIVQMNHRQSH